MFNLAKYFRVATNVKAQLGDKPLLTEAQWLKKGFIPIDDTVGEWMWANQNCCGEGWRYGKKGVFRYLLQEEVKLKNEK